MFKKKVDECFPNFGGTFIKYQTVFFGKTDTDKRYTIEPFIEGNFEKYVNNNGNITNCSDLIRQDKVDRWILI